MVKSTQLQPSIRRLTMNVSLTCNVELRSQEMKLKLLTILKTSIRTYAVSLPRYAYTVLTRDRSIDDSAHHFEPAISRYLSWPAIRSIYSRDTPLIVLLLLLPTCLLFNACSIQYCTLTSLEPLILHCGFPGAVHIALWVT